MRSHIWTRQGNSISETSPSVVNMNDPVFKFVLPLSTLYEVIMENNKPAILALKVDVAEATDLDAWDHQPGENKVWFSRFNNFRLLGPNRTVKEAHRRERERYRGLKNPAVPLGYARDWNDTAMLWQWKDRAEAWDIYMQSQQEDEAYNILTDGLAMMHKRVEVLKEQELKLREYLNSPKNKPSSFIWEQWRGIVKDLAEETGGRNKEVRITGPKGGPVVIQTEWGRGGIATKNANEMASEVLQRESPRLITEISEAVDEKPE